MLPQGESLFGCDHETDKQQDMSEMPSVVNIASGTVNDHNFAKMTTIHFKYTYHTFPCRLYKQVLYPSNVDRRQCFGESYFIHKITLIVIDVACFGGVFDAKNVSPKPILNDFYARL